MVGSGLAEPGIATKLLRVAEKTAPAEVTSYELSTGALSERNLQLYRNAGYREIRREQQTPQVELVWLAKRRRRPAADFVAVTAVWQTWSLLPFGAPATGGDHRMTASSTLTPSIRG